MKNDDITRLLDEYTALADSPRNKNLLQETWLRPNVAYLGNVGVPRAGAIPIIANPHHSVWAREMGISIAEIYLDPHAYLRVWLSREIGRFRQMRDDQPLGRQVTLVVGNIGFESSLFGSHLVYMADQDPMVDRTPILQQPDDLNRLQPPDFHKSGLMPLAHGFYNELSELVNGHGLEVLFRDWLRGPLAVAMQLRGQEQFLLDMLERPSFVAKLLDFLTDSAIHYRTERARFLGIPADKPELHNDEVSVPSISPKLYRDLVLPREKAYAAAFGGLTYWHSCGNVTPMIPAIREIPDITIFNVGPCTNVRRAAQAFSDTALDICVHGRDAYDANDEGIHTSLASIVQTCWQHGAHLFNIRADPLQSFGSVEEHLAAGARWVKVARQTIAQLASSEGAIVYPASATKLRRDAP